MGFRGILPYILLWLKCLSLFNKRIEFVQLSFVAGPSTSKAVTGSSSSTDDDFEKDDGFREFRRLCANIADESSYLSKTNLVQKYLTKGTSGGMVYVCTL